MISCYCYLLQKYAFNKYVSDQINVKREMPDTRHADCRKIDYDPPQTLPKTSVILIFCNEAISVLLRYEIGKVRSFALYDDDAASREERFRSIIFSL